MNSSSGAPNQSDTQHQIATTMSSIPQTSAGVSAASTGGSDAQTVLNLADPVESAQLLSTISETLSQHPSWPNLSPQEYQQVVQQHLSNLTGGGGGVQGGEQGHDHQHQHQHNPDNQQPAGPFAMIIQALQSSFPFLAILVAKIFHQHLLGFFIVLGFLTTLHWSNRTLVNQVQLKEKKQNHKLLLLILFLLLNVVIFFYIFKDYRMERCLIFLSPSIQKMDTWNLLWIVVCSDIIIKFLVISAKSLILLLPFRIFPLRKRGSMYSLVETLSLFYRCLVPIHPWLLFLLYNEPNLNFVEDKINLKIAEDFNKINTNNSTLFQIFLCILYCIFKFSQIYYGFLAVYQAAKDFIYNPIYGVPTALSNTEEKICPICQDKFSSNPVMLKCKHVFCEDCICIWLDKENSCPMCRTKIAIKKPVFRDGSTSILIQWF